MGDIKRCEDCRTYTLEDTCPECGSGTGDPEPPKFSFPDRYGDYRRETRKGDN
ncbi:MAG: RNA-protein complex protein Nop10 [Candidatus Nanohaloarchaea archaeon]|nr:RNA-protein complex protein Nop10 [Candidatus Nanohaloarchaea archaeon]